MPAQSNAYDQMVTELVPSLSRSLAEQFNVFRVMHHGTHEKQLSNVFAWLLRADGTHELGDTFQRLFVEQVNRGLSEGGRLPTSGYRVVQEVDTSGQEGLGRDIADIVLTCQTASILVENFESSDGHGHDYHGYLAHGAAGDKQSVVVLLCSRRESHRQADGWEEAVVVTYAELLGALRAHVAGDNAWRRSHPEQNFFVHELFHHFLEGPPVMSDEDRISFIKTMCETGESARYGHRPQEVAAQEFADLLARHAMHQFEEGRGTLAGVKRALKRFAEQTLREQINALTKDWQLASVRARYVGQWEWCVELRRSNSLPSINLEFGPTAVVENRRVPEPLREPDYAKVFVTLNASGRDGIDAIVQTDVGLVEVLAGLSDEDVRLRDSVLSVAYPAL
jgi:PD-(D/E)XK nuclease superfamily